MMLHTQYKRPGPSTFRQEDLFKFFPYTILCETSDPQGRGHFLPHGYNLNNLGRGPLDDATYPISKAWALYF